MVALYVVAVAGLVWSPVHVSDERLWRIAVVLAASAGLLALAGRVPEVRPVAERCAALSRSWTVQVMLAYDAMALSPWAMKWSADQWLGVPERWTGADYHVAASLCASYGVLCPLRVVYQVGGLVPLVLAVTAPVTLNRITDSFARASWVGLVASVLLPAYGYGDRGGWLAGSLAAHSGASVLLAALPSGLFCPSFHAVSGALVACSGWSTRWRWLALAWGACVVLSAWVVGEHYLADLAVGTGLGCAAWRSSR